MTLWLSYSGADAWRDCPQRYWYRFEDKIMPKSRPNAAFSLGNWIHRYLERYYRALQKGGAAEKSHTYALEYTRDEYHDQLIGMAEAARIGGDEELAAELLGQEALAVGIVSRYFQYRGRADADRYEVLYVEYRLEHPAHDNMRVPGVIDLVVRDDQRGLTQMWDHKSTRNTPDPNSHILDMQMVLYTAMLEEETDLRIDEMVWNYLRTVEPAKPHLLKSGKALSKDRGIDTTLDLYREAIIENGFDPTEYTDVFDRLSGREYTVFYPRHTLPVVPEAENIIIRDFLRTGEEIAEAKSKEEYIPIRNVGRRCDWCDYRKLCEATISGGDTEETIKRHYEVKK